MRSQIHPNEKKAKSEKSIQAVGYAYSADQKRRESCLFTPREALSVGEPSGRESARDSNTQLELPSSCVSFQ